MQTHFQRQDRITDPLYVVTTVFNASRWRSRWKLYEDFAKRVKEAGAKLLTVEVAFGDRLHAVTEPGNPFHIQLRTPHEIWIKENALNLGVSRLPSDWKYVAWIDADVAFTRDDWANETLHALQHYDVVQLFSEAVDLTSNHEVMFRYRSFCHSKVHGIPWRTGFPAKSPYGGAAPVPLKKPSVFAYQHHPGFAWATKRHVWDALGGLFDVAVIGEADFIMARAFMGEAESAVRPGVSDGYMRYVREWEKRALAHVRGNIGYVPGTLLHYWHGVKSKRLYWDRTQILKDSGYDPDLDLKRDYQGLYQLTPRSIMLRDQVRAYFAQRDEDSPTPEDLCPQ